MVTSYQPDSPREPPTVALPMALTAEEFESRSSEFGRSQLVAGKVQLMSPCNFGHGFTITNLAHLLRPFVKKRRLGAVISCDVGFILARNPDTVLAPDIAFVAASRLPTDRWFKFFEGPPDLAVEVVSPDDRKAEVHAKAHAWLAAGTRLVWIVNPMTQRIAIYRPGTAVEELSLDNALDGGDVIPGFSCAIAEVFDVP
jgi:Uma2 family endonuclease